LWSARHTSTIPAGPQQREAQRLSRESLGEDFGDNA